jgi:hypothetical protein
MACPTLEADGPSFRYPSSMKVEPTTGVKRSRDENPLQHASVKPLDPISVAGCINMNRIISLAEQEKSMDEETRAMLQRLEKGTLLEWGIQETGTTNALIPIFSHGKYAEHGRYLVAVGVAKGTDPTEIKEYAAYCTVDKTEEHSRAIIDCRRTNGKMRRPPALILIQMHEVIWLLLFFTSPAFAVRDLRHFFWQIPLAGNDCRWFGVRFRDGKAPILIRCLPMGFSWSPSIAQTISTLLAVAGTKWKHDAWKGRPYITITREDGSIIAFIVIFYDNFLVIAKDEDTRTALMKTLLGNIKKVNAKIKGGEERPMEGVLLTRGVFDFLGVMFERQAGELIWWHKGKNVMEWNNLLKKGRMTTRDGYGLAGICIWDKTVATAPMLEIAEVLDTMAAIAGAKVNWEDPLQESWRECLKCAVAQVVRREPYKRSRSELTERRLILVATDASDWGGGAVVWSEDKQARVVFADPWSEGDKIRPIYQRGMIAACRTILRLANSEVTVMIAVDNSTVVSALRHRYSKCPFLRLELESIRHMNYEVVWVPSAVNVADAPSRGRAMEPAVAESCRLWPETESTAVGGRARPRLT